MTSSSPYCTQLRLLESTTTLDAQFLQKQDLDQHGQILTKECVKCRKVKHLIEFGTKRDTRDYLQPWCKMCVSIYSAQWRQNLSDAEYLWKGARGRAKRKGREFTITLADVETIDFNTFCPILTDIKFAERFHVPHKRQCHLHPAAKTLDRIDASKGYIPGNIRIISWRANNLLKDVTNEEWELLVQNRNYNPSTTLSNATSQVKDNTN